MSIHTRAARAVLVVMLYIPYPAQVDSKLFGVSVVTTDNQSYPVGDTTYAFSIQREPRPSGSGFRKGTNPAGAILGSRS